MQIDKGSLLNALNKDLELEFAAAVQYIQHAAVISGSMFEGIQKELLVHSQEEMLHAVSLSEQIVSLGGLPSVDVETRHISRQSIEMLKQDLSGEETAIVRYRVRIGQAEELHEYGLRRALEDILIQEEEHKRDLLMVIEPE
jgi:bacterioferritin